MVPPRVSSLILYILNLVLELTHRILPNFRDHLCHQPPSGRFRVYQVTQLRTSGVHCRESAGTGLVLNSARRSSSSGWCLFKCRHEPIFMSLFSYTHNPSSPPSEHPPVRGENVKTFSKKNQGAPRPSEHPPVKEKISNLFYTVCINSIYSISSAGYRTGNLCTNGRYCTK